MYFSVSIKSSKCILFKIKNINKKYYFFIKWYRLGQKQIDERVQGVLYPKVSG